MVSTYWYVLLFAMYFLYGYMYIHGPLLLSQQTWLYIRCLRSILYSECFYDSPPLCLRRFQNRSCAFSPSFFFFARPACLCGSHLNLGGGAIVETLFHVFILYAYMYVAPRDKSCRYCYDFCRNLRLFSLGTISYMYTLLLHVY